MKYLPLVFPTIQIVLAILFVQTFGFDEHNMAFLTRVTAKISFITFLFVFLASPLFFIQKNTFSTFLKRNRKSLGLTFASAHFVHLFVLLILAWITNGESLETRKGFVFWTGFFAYLTITAMVITSFQKPKALLGGKNWKRLHTFGTWLVGIIFLFSYGGRSVLFPTEYLPFGLAIVGALFTRGYTTIKTKSAK